MRSLESPRRTSRDREPPRRIAEPVERTKRAILESADFGSLFQASRREDDVLATVGDLVIRKRHVYDRLLEVDPLRLREVEEALRLDVRVVELSRTLEVSVPDAELDYAVRREWARVERAYEKERAGATSIEDFVVRGYSMTSEEFRRHVRMLAWRRLMRSYTIRYAQRRSGAVRLQRFVARTREAAQRARGEILGGGDFGRIAEKASVGGRARAGGRLPLLPLDCGHSALALAEGAASGGLGPVRATKLEDGSEGYGFVRVLERTEPDERPFRELYTDLRRELERRPIERAEIIAFTSS